MKIAAKIAALVLSGLALAPFAGVAQAQTPQMLTVGGAAAPRGDAWQASLGVRGMLIRDPGYDPFSTNDGLTQVALTVSRVAMRQDRMALAAGLSLESGSADAAARGAPSDLGLTRVSLFAEGRYAPHPRLYAFLRAAPGVLNVSATLHDPSAPNGPTTTGGAAMSDTFNLPSFEGSGGAAFCLAPASSAVGAWIVAEGGYAWAPSHELLLASQLPAADQSKVAALDLGALAPRGPFFSASFALSY